VLFTTIAKAKMKKTEPDGKGTLVGLVLLVRSNQLLTRARGPIPFILLPMEGNEQSYLSCCRLVTTTHFNFYMLL
jgi:hypothetical protein